MIKIKIKDKPNFIKNKIKGKNINVLECVVLLDIVIDMLENDFNLSDKEIWNLLKEYRDCKKEVR